MRTITCMSDAYLISRSDLGALRSEDQSQAIDAMAFSQQNMRNSGWTFVGKASITVEVADEKQIIVSAVETLRAEIQKTRADAEIKCRSFEDQISKLLAIEYSV